MKTTVFIFFILLCNFFYSQTFTRSELPTPLNAPWEIIYGPDGFLWITESGGKVVRVDPANGNKTSVYTAPDYFAGSAVEQSTLCFHPNIGAGTLGMALHPGFTNSATAFIYFVYSYNSGTTQAPATKFKIERLTWNSTTNAVTANTTIVNQMPTGYDHLGGRLIIGKQNNTPYLFFSVGDNGVSDINEPGCYAPQSTNPNNFAQDPNYKNGKIHRFNLDGTIPADNPIAGNSFYTRGHRNPQGLIYNSDQNIIYDTEHGDRTDDEINVLVAGMNYGWKYVRGYFSDNNYPGEATFVANYTPNAAIANDALKEPIFTWCSTPQPTISAFLDWCTVAPSGGKYYNSSAIPGWANSLLVVTLKDGSSTDMEMYQFKLSANGLSIDASVSPNPKRFFAADQALNGRLRDLAVSPDGTKIYLVNNGGTSTDKITVYTYDVNSGLSVNQGETFHLELYPNPTAEPLLLKCSETINSVALFSMMGDKVKSIDGDVKQITTQDLAAGVYVCYIRTVSGRLLQKKFVKE